MIYPSRGAILAVAAGAPLVLLVGAFLPGRWYAGLAWPAAVLLLCLVDALSGTRPAQAEARLSLPPSAYVGAPVAARVDVGVAGAAPSSVEIALALGPLVEAADEGRSALPLDAGRGAGTIELLPIRRGTAAIDLIWLRWRGRFGLVWKQRRIALDARLPILPDISAARDRGAQIFQRHALQGLMTQLERGDGAEFDSLVEYRPGMDRRAIDWKQSARHRKLHAKEYRTERNNHIVLAIDCGRQMSEPIAGLPRIDRAVSAALLAAWVALKLGDRVALFAFDARPRIASGAVGGTRSFATLQRVAAGIDYSGEETNYTFALTTLAARLDRRSMIVLFTEFTDPISADFMVRAAARLVQTHLLLFVVMHDAELDEIAARAPDTADDVTRAVTAAALLRERQVVLGRLRRIGVHVVESAYDQVGERLVAGYIDLKRRNLL